MRTCFNDHEIFKTSNCFSKLAHLEKMSESDVNLHHELSESYRLLFSSPVWKVVEFVNTRGNPFIVN